MKIACAIPLYNNAATILTVAARCRQQLDHVLVVDDGSTDLPDHFADSLAALDVALIRHPRNRGKGAALQTALAELARQQVDYMITIDADGQHLPEDLPLFCNLLNREGQANDLIVIGVRDFSVSHVPASSRFGRSFSNFWVKLETGVSCADTQSGFRAYPVAPLCQLRLRCHRYNFEIEALVRALWSGIRHRDIPIRVIYAPPGQRISHFRPFADNARLSLLHTTLVLRRLCPLPARRLVPPPPDSTPSPWQNPRAFLLSLLHENTSPEMLGVSAATGTFLAILPLISCHMLAILYVCCRLRLNKIMALAIQNLFMPPLTPFICIQTGYFIRHGAFLREASLQTVVGELHLRLWEWLLGSLVIAPPAAAIGFFRVMLATLGPTCACLFAAVVALFYALGDRTARRAATPYLQRRFPQDGPLRQTWHFYRLLVAQGQVIILAHWLRAGHHVPVHEEYPDFLRQALRDRQRGLILLISHVGCWQAALTCLATYQRPVNLLIQTNANRPIAELFSASHQITVISNDAPFGGLLACVAALERGEIVCIMGDRVAGDREQTATTTFLGQPLAVPLAPWLLAARCHCPVVPVFTLMQGLARAITFHFAPPIEIAYDSPRKPGPDTFAPQIRQYAASLDQIARQYPYQIFHFNPKPEPPAAGDPTWTTPPPASATTSN